MNFKKYHVSKNLWNYQPDITSVGVTLHWDGEKIVFANTCTSSNNLMFTYGTLPAGTYTLKANANRIPVDNVNVCIDLYQPSPFFQKKINNDEAVNGTITFTLTEALTDARLRIHLNSGVNYDGFTLAPMLNSGDSSLPYEPYSSEVWHDIPYYQHKTATDTLTLPATLYPNDTSITVGLKGNEEHTGTPSPQNPVMPNGTGERTGNLFDEVYSSIDTTIRYKPIYVGNGTFTLSTNQPFELSVADIFFLSGNVSTGAATHTNGVWVNHNITVDSSEGYVTIAYRHYNNTTSPTDCNTMLNTGSTALPYEPYGYKLTISSANTTTPVYLGEVETTRQIKELILNGTENWIVETGPAGMYSLPNVTPLVQYANQLCTHFPLATSYSEFYYNDLKFCVANRPCLLIHYNACQTVSEFKAFLAAEYSAGHPVTVWYVLPTPQTAVVNEPLRKIGDYADEVSGITIPTIAGANTLSVDTTLQPSEVSVNYHGWHPVQSVHERENGAWT